MNNKLYRYVEIHFSLGCDQFGDPYPGHKLELYLNEYEIVKRTPKGVWISLHYSNKFKKFVLLTARKKFACLTKEDALESFIYRKKRQIEILKSKLQDAEKSLILANNIKKSETNSHNNKKSD